jgi:hypothetical protein
VTGPLNRKNSTLERYNGDISCEAVYRAEEIKFCSTHAEEPASDFK